MSKRLVHISLTILITAMHPLLRRQLGTNAEAVSPQSKYTLEALGEDVVQESANQFLDCIRAKDITLKQVRWTKKESLPWNRPNIFGEAAFNEEQTCRFHEVLESMDKETPIAMNDFLSVPVEGQSDTMLCGQLVAEVDESLFGFAGDLLELVTLNSTPIKYRSTMLESPSGGVTDLVPKVPVFRKNLLAFAKGLGPQRGCVVCGEMGTGRTHSAMMLAAVKKLQNDAETFYLDCRALKHSVDVRMRTILEQIKALGKERDSSTKPACFIIDNIDVFVAGNDSQPGSLESAQNLDADAVEIDQSKLILDILLSKILQSIEYTGYHGNFYILTCESTSNLDQFLKDCEFWGSVYTIDPLNALERLSLLQSSMYHSGATCPDLSGAGFEKLSVGYRCRDFTKFAARLRSTGSPPSARDIVAEMKRFVPICRIGVSLSSRVDSLKLDDMGALFEAKRCLGETVIRPSRYRRLYAAAKIRLPRGVLLYGHPGTGKTALATALANECGFSLVTCSGPELLDKYIGASEAKVRELFYRAASAAPSILFFDEFDALAPRRGSDNSGVTDRIVNQLLTFLDGVSDLSKKSEGAVFIVAASSRPDKIDPALLRPGRLEKHIFCGLVDDEIQRQDLLLKLSSKYPLDSVLAAELSSGALFERIELPKTGLSGADVDGIFSAAHTKAIHEVIKRTPMGCMVDVEIKTSHFRSACSEASLSIPPDELERLNAIYERFSGKKPTDTPSLDQAQRIAFR